jgi:hypothetical protein
MAKAGKMGMQHGHFSASFKVPQITLVNTRNVSLTKIVESSSIQCAESKYGLRIQFLALVVMIHGEA